MRFWKLSYFTVASLCSILLIVVYGTRTEKPLTPRAYRMISTETVYPKDGEPRLVALRIRWVKAIGDWKETVSRIAPNNSVSGGFTMYTESENQYAQDKDGDALQFIGKMPRSIVPITPQFLRNHKEFVRTETLLGHTTYVFRSEPTPGKWVELHRIPEIGEIPVKVVMSSKSGRRTVIEAVSIDFDERINDMTIKPADLPVKTDCLQRMADDAEKQGFEKYANALRQAANSLQK